MSTYFHKPIEELYKDLPDYFSYNEDLNNNAYLNWRFTFSRDADSQFYQLGEAYMKTAMLILDECLTDNLDKKSDVWIFPILFNVVHSIEVYLKGFNSQMQRLIKLQFNQELTHSKIEGGHNIKQLCQVAISNFNKYIDQSSNIDVASKEAQEKKTEFNFLLKFITNLYEKTDDMSFMRYSIDNKKKEPQFYAERFNSENIVIDLEVFKIWINKIFCILDNITGFVDYLVDQLEEIYHEYNLQY